MPEQKSVGHYELVEVLGRGSFGTVWEARHTELGRLAAVKVLDRLPPDGRRSERFLREAQISGNLRHANIVTLLESGYFHDDTGDTPYLAYELIEGVKLGEWSAFAPLVPREIAALVAKIASAVHYAHQRGIVHRDLKPDNILIDLSGDPHITDFGLAKRLDDRFTERNVTLGTIAYMSPEQAAGKSGEVGPLSDVFSLGVILFELLTGKLPFDSSSIAAYVSDVAKQEPQLPLESGRKIPRDLTIIALKCLAKKPTERYASAQALEEDLVRFVAGKPIKARAVSVPERLRRWAVRQPLAATLIGLLAIVAIVGPTVAINQTRLRRELEETASDLRSENYATDVYLAYQAWNDRRLKRARQMLDRARAVRGELDHRDFAWHYLNDRLEEAYSVVAKTDAPINDFAFSKNRRQLLTVGASGSLGFWEVTSGKQLRSIPLSHHSQFAVALMGSSVLVGDQRDGLSVVDIYDLESCELTESLPLATANTIESIRVSSDESFFTVAARYDGIHFFDAVGNTSTYFENHDRNENVKISPDMKYVAASINIMRDGNHFYGVLIWSVKRKAIVKTREFPAKVLSLAWRNDSKYLAAHLTRHKDAQLLSIPDLELVNTIPHGHPEVVSVDFYADGRTIAFADQFGAVIERPMLFGGESYGDIDYFAHEAEVNRLQYFGRGRFLTVSDDGTAALTQPEELKRQGVNVLMTVGEDATATYSYGQNAFYVGDRSGKLRNQSGKILYTFDEPIKSLTLVDDGTKIACGLQNGTVCVVSCAEGSLLNTWKASSGSLRAVDAMAETSAREGLVSGGADSTLRLWSGKDNTCEFEYEVAGRVPAIVVDKIRGLAFVAGHSEHVTVFDLRQKHVSYRLPSNRATALAIDQVRSILISGHEDGSIIVWDLSHQTKIEVLRGHIGRVRSLAISSDGDILASSSSAGGVRFWNLKRLEEIGVAYQPRADREVVCLAFSPSGDCLYGIQKYGDRCSLVIRMGGPRETFAGYHVVAHDFDCRHNVDWQEVDRDGEQVLVSKNTSSRPGQVGIWLSEKCKGYEVRATFRLDLINGGAKAHIDHYYSHDADTDSGFWVGSSPTIRPGRDLSVQTDWVRVTEGDWYAGPDKSQHSYAAILALDPGAKAAVHSVDIEARQIR